jgi:hypothetical protein
MSGTIPSMETSHESLKDNTVIIGTSFISITQPSHDLTDKKVLGASGDLAKKKVSRSALSDAKKAAILTRG